MTTSFPQMLGLLAGDIDRDGVDEVICVQETHEGHSRLAALNLEGNISWCYDFPDFNGRAPIWNETGTTIWALGHFTDPEQLDIMVSNRRSIMHSDETVLLNIEEKTQVWHRDILEVREPWTDTPWKHTRGYGGGVVAIADFDGDGLDDIALCYPAEYSIVKGINGEQYALESTGPLKGTNSFWVIGGYPMAVDLNGDGKMDTLWVSQSIIIAFAPRETCTDILWHTEPGDGASGTPAYGDSDGDGYPEIGLPGFKDGFRCIAPASGNTLYTVPQYGDGASNCVAIDINNDGLEEFLYANGSCLLAVAQRKENLDPFIWKLELPSAIKNLALGDVDNDGNIEILASGTDGIIYCVK